MKKMNFRTLYYTEGHYNPKYRLCAVCINVQWYNLQFCSPINLINL